MAAKVNSDYTCYGARMRFMVCLGLLWVASGCAYNRQYSRPTERVRGQTVQGYQESFYDLVGAGGRFGEAKVWSVGAYRHDKDSVIEVTLDVHNTSGKPIEVSAGDLKLDPVRGPEGELRGVPAAETGTFGVAAESQASMRVHFLLPDGWLPGHVRSFVFVWKVKSPEQSYAQATPFREDIPYYPAPPGYLYYDPVYPCSPYDLSCVGFYGSWPYGGQYGYGGPPGVIIERTPPVERRRVEVR